MAKMVKSVFANAMDCSDMKSSFPGYFSSTDENLNSLWASGLIVLDTNVLLNLYRYSDSTKTELLAIINQLSDRIWIPNQVAKEFLSNRLIVIGEQSDLYKSHISALQDFKRPLESQKKHPFISEELFRECDTIFEKLKKELETSKKLHDERINNDDIKSELSIILDGKVGKGYDKEALEKIILDGESRYNQKTPPGFKDIKKGGDSKLFNDRLLKYGDYIIWLQILEHAKSDESSVIFVTGDVKEDWWLTFNGRTIAPHPLLVEEFSNIVGLPFHMYPVDVFLERAGQHLQKITSEDSLKEIREVQSHEEYSNQHLDITINHIWPKSSVQVETNILQENDESIEQLSISLDDYKIYPDIDYSHDIDLPWNEPTEALIARTDIALHRSIANLTREQQRLISGLRSLKERTKGLAGVLTEAEQVNRMKKMDVMSHQLHMNERKLRNLHLAVRQNGGHKNTES
ncbi:PIN domain-containing protein [Pseudomonas syringae]|uniref:PIN domain-containing protein n=1 Tax=Pseudomonas syringae TaxID=317 RepID=UPI000405224C|nr:PIN domain-containing protein [Pseudomonas syringae]